MLGVESCFWVLCFFWLIVWADGINKWDWCLAGDRGCWLKGLQIPSISWIFHHSLHFYIYLIVLFVPRILGPLYNYYKWWDGIGWGGWLISSYGWGDGGGYDIIIVFFTYVFVFCFLRFSVSFFKWLEHASCCLFLCLFFSLFLVSLTNSYWYIEMIVSVMSATIHKVIIWS